MGRLNNSLVVSDNQLLKEKGYELNKLLGEGSFSKVKSAIWKKPGTTEVLHVAVKIINKITAPKPFLEKFLPRETEIMKKLSHENIVQLYDIFAEGNKIYMSLEQAGHGDLLEYILLKGSLDMPETHLNFSQLLSGIDYLHSNKIIHRDLKCENILRTKENKLKIADFGFAKLVEDQSLSETFCGSAAYASPEVLKGIPYQPQIPDMWSLGVILFIMACGSMPFSDSNVNRLIKEQEKPTFCFPEEVKPSGNYCNLVRGMLRCDLRKRIIEVASVVKHKWMQNSEKLFKKPMIDSFINTEVDSSSDISEPLNSNVTVLSVPQ